MDCTKFTMLTFFGLLCLFLVAQAEPFGKKLTKFPIKGRNRWCEKMMAGLNLNDTGVMVAHGSHSLSLNMLRHYFDEDAPEDNDIPTVNLDRSAENKLHENAIFIKLKNSHDN